MGYECFLLSYQCSTYFTAGRANGLSFWESSAVAAIGSAAWEFYRQEMTGRASFEGALLELAQVHLVGLHGGEVLHHPAAGGVERLRRDDDVTGDQLLRLDEGPVEHTDAVP